MYNNKFNQICRIIKKFKTNLDINNIRIDTVEDSNLSKAFDNDMKHTFTVSEFTKNICKIFTMGDEVILRIEFSIRCITNIITLINSRLIFNCFYISFNIIN